MDFTLPNGCCVVNFDAVYFWSIEVDLLLDETAAAQSKLGWRNQTSLRKLVGEMVATKLEVKQSAPAGASAPLLVGAEASSL